MNIAKDMNEMHAHYGFHDKLKDMSKEERLEFLRFRFDFLGEELEEGILAVDAGDAEEVVDALIDLIVVAAGTLDLFEVDAEVAWNEVLRANMEKEVGEKETRKNEFGFPDLVKPELWEAPSHKGNHGLIG